MWQSCRCQSICTISRVSDEGEVSNFVTDFLLNLLGELILTMGLFSFSPADFIRSSPNGFVSHPWGKYFWASLAIEYSMLPMFWFATSSSCPMP